MREELAFRIKFIKRKMKKAQELLRKKRRMRKKFLAKGDRFKKVVDNIIE